MDTPIRAVILDLDGVITRTAAVHARAWKQMFDDYLAKRGQQASEDHQPFRIDEDYPEYVDGKPRYEGVRSFLESRGIHLPEGSPDDKPGKETICGLGNRKNQIFLELIDREGVQVYEHAVEQIDRWRDEGMKLAMVTSSRNGANILKAAGLTDRFDVRLDGNDIKKLGLRGKPEPDMFVEAARQLGIDPQQAMVLEDAVAGVKAGQRGGFGLVVGVARERRHEALFDAGADLVVDDLRELSGLQKLRQAQRRREQSQRTPSALDHAGDILARLRNRPPALFLDYDGTLTPIVERPEDARLSEEMKQAVQALARRFSVAIVSGRDLHDVRRMVGLDELVYAGSHGFDILGPDGLRMQQEDARAALPELDQAQEKLGKRLSDIRGVRVERKGFAVAVHFRQAAEIDLDRIEHLVDRIQQEHPTLRKRSGKKIFELQPDVEWDKGHAVRWLFDALGLKGQSVTPLYLGDDTTDEDAFEALRDIGISIRCGSPQERTSAQYLVHEVGQVQAFLQLLLEKL